MDFVELQRGLILERRMNRDEALMYIRKYAGRLYDPELIEPFIQVCATTLADVTLADPQVRAHGTRDLVPGMVLARNLTANNGMLLLNAGKVLNLALIEADRLRSDRRRTLHAVRAPPGVDDLGGSRQILKRSTDERMVAATSFRRLAVAAISCIAWVFCCERWAMSSTRWAISSLARDCSRMVWEISSTTDAA